MTKEMWINLPVKNVNKAKEFFTSIGFSLNTRHPVTDDAASLMVGEKGFIVMLFLEKTFKSFTQNELAETKKGTEVLISFDAESKEEVDEMAKKVTEAGGNVFNQPESREGWMYGCGFTDLDGHRWNILHMDFSKLPKP